MPNDPKQSDQLRKKIEDLNNQLSQVPAADVAQREEIQTQIAEAEKSLKHLEVLPSGQNYKLGEVVNVFFEGDTIKIDNVQKIQRDDGPRIWANATLVKRAESAGASAVTSNASPRPSVASPETTPEKSPAKSRTRRHSR